MRALSIRLKRNGNLKQSKTWQPRMESMEPRTLLSAVNWTGAGGDNNWDTAANWDTNSVPGSAADVRINIAANVVHSKDVTDSINSLTSTEPLTISGGTLSIAAVSTISSTLSITGGTLTGTGDLNVSGLVTLTAGTLSGASSLNANGGMLINPVFSAVNNYFYIAGRTINNAAGQTATWGGDASYIQASDASIFNNYGNFITSGFTVYSQGTGALSSFVNEGSFTTAAGSEVAGFEVRIQRAGRFRRRPEQQRSRVERRRPKHSRAVHNRVNGAIVTRRPIPLRPDDRCVRQWCAR